MKNVTTKGLLAAGCVVMVLSACNNNGNGAGNTDSTDSKKQAMNQNDSTLDSTNTKKDAAFAVAAADGGMLEVQLGKLAQDNASSASVKAFGKEMVTDHSKANDELVALAQKKGIAVPSTLSDKSQKTYNDLAAKKGADFDKAYAALMVSDHKEDIGDFQKEANDGNDADIKAWAQGKLPVLQHHLDMANMNEDKMKGM